MERLCGNYSEENDSMQSTSSVRMQLLSLVIESMVFVMGEFLDLTKGKNTESDRGTRQTSAQALLSLVAEVLEQEAKLQIETMSESGDKGLMERRHDAWRSPALSEALGGFCKENNPSDTRRVAKHIQCVTAVCIILIYVRFPYV